MAGLKGNLGSIKGLKSRIRAMPVTVAHAVAQRAAPAMTQLTTQAFASKRNVYGEARPVGVNGQPLTLEATGATKRTLGFTANGTVLRCQLGTRWAKYLIGKYGVLPNGGLPAAWSQRLGQIVDEVKP